MNIDQTESLRNIANAAKRLRVLEERAKQTGPGGLMHFVRYFWPVLEPSREFIDGWVLDAIAEHLEAVTNGDIKRLLINVPPGPMRDDSIIETARGQVLLKDIRVGDLVLTHLGRYKPVSAVHQQGILQTLKIVTNSGRVTFPALSHPYLTPTGWVEAGQLSVGDLLAVVNRIEDRPNAPRILPEEARMLGYLVGDGGLTQATPNFTNADREVIEDFHYCAKALGFRTSESRARNHWTVRLNGGIIVRKWLQKHNLVGADSYTKRIPLAVMNGDRQTLMEFIGAYWTCDGGFDVRASRTRGSIYRAYGTTVSEGLAVDLVYALGLLGIESRLRRKSRPLKTKKQPGGNYISYSIEIQKEVMTARFSDFTSLCTQKRKIADKCRRAFSVPLWDDAIILIEDAGVANCMCLTVEEDHSFVCSGIAVKNSMKSLMSNCFHPAWEWGPMNMPHLRTLSFSYSSHLTERDNEKFKTLITSKPYKELWGDRFSIVGDAKIKVSNDKMGWRLASSVGGVTTGERGDRIVADDLHNAAQGESDRVRSETVRWFKESMSDRLNDLRKSTITVIMQRVHEEDVAGTIIAEKNAMGYDRLLIPMRHEIDFPFETSTRIGWSDPRHEDGELAWPARFPPEEVNNIERDKGPFAFSAQYQQNPSPRGGGIIKRNWWRLWGNENTDKFPYCEYRIASLDPAYTEKEENDPSGMTIWGIFRHPETNEPGLILMNAWEKRLPIHGDTSPRFPGESLKAYERRCGENWGLLEWVWHCCESYDVNQLVIEGKASGISVYQEIERRQDYRKWATTLMDTGRLDKTARVYSIQGIFSQGLIWAPDRDWANKVIDQFAAFPKAKNDDLVDASCQAIRTLRDMGMLQFQDEREFEEYVENNRPQALLPLYPV